MKYYIVVIFFIFSTFILISYYLDLVYFLDKFNFCFLDFLDKINNGEKL